MNLLQRLEKQKLIHPPGFLTSNTQYLVMMGSVAYGVSDDTSDNDVLGFCIPSINVVFPHLAGEIIGFGRPKNCFEQWQKHHVHDPGPNKDYDFVVYNIVKYFTLCMECNPNMICSLFVPQRCVLQITQAGTHARENRKLFLHKGAWHRFKGYSYSQLHKMANKKPEGKRLAIVEKYGYDTKYAYHLVRLLNEVEQILVEHDLDVERNREQLKSIRRGEWTEKQLRDYFSRKERDLETVYSASTLRDRPDVDGLRKLLLECLEIHYGSLSGAVVVPGVERLALQEIKRVCEKVGV